MTTKGEVAQILTFGIAPALGAGAAWWAVRSRLADTLSAAAFRRTVVALWALSRIGTHLVVFPLFGYAGGWDLLAVWVPIAETVLGGGDPAPLVDNLYGPLYPHVLAAGLAAGGGSYAPAAGLGFLAGDAALLWLLLRIARRRLDEPAARRVLLLVLLSPLLWHGVIVRSQDEPLFVALLLLVQDLLDRRRERSAVLAAAAGTLLTKALFPLYVLPVLLAAEGSVRERTRRVAAAGGATVAALAVAMLAGWQPATAAHGTLSIRGASSWWLVFAGPGAAPTRGVFVAGLAVTALLCVAAAARAALRRPGESPPERAALGVTALQGVFFAVSPFTLASHLVHGLAHVAWRAVTAPPRRAALLLVPLLALQVVACWLPVEDWRRAPWLVLAFAAWSAWTVWDAWSTRPDGAARASPAPS